METVIACPDLVGEILSHIDGPIHQLRTVSSAFNEAIIDLKRDQARQVVDLYYYGSHDFGCLTLTFTSAELVGAVLTNSNGKTLDYFDQKDRRQFCSTFLFHIPGLLDGSRYYRIHKVLNIRFPSIASPDGAFMGFVGKDLAVLTRAVLDHIVRDLRNGSVEGKRDAAEARSPPRPGKRKYEPGPAVAS